MVRVGISLLLILMFAFSTITLPHAVNAASPVHVSVLGTPVTVGSSFQISFYIDVSYCTTCGTATAYVRSNSSYTHIWEGSPMTVKGGLDYEVNVPGISGPGSYFAGVTVIGLSSGGLPGVAVLRETPFSVVGSTSGTAAPRTFFTPPSQFGCYSNHKLAGTGKNNPEEYLTDESQNNTSWTKTACLSKTEVAQLPPPVEGAGLDGSGPGIYGLHSLKANIGSAGVEVRFSQLSGDTDSINGDGYWSIQLNTNDFVGENVHHDWIQFVAQGTVKQGDHVINACVWEIDLDANPEGNPPGDYTTNTLCLQIPYFSLGDLINYEVDGYAYPPGNTFIQGGVAALITYFGFPDINLWWAVGGPDAFGFTSSDRCNGNPPYYALPSNGDRFPCWTDVDGTILGVGNGAKIIFTAPTKEITTLSEQYYPLAPSIINWYGGVPGIIPGIADYSLLKTTAETNNMQYDRMLLPSLACGTVSYSPLGYCILSTASTT